MNTFIFLVIALLIYAWLWRISCKLPLEDNLILLFSNTFLVTNVLTMLDRNLKWFASTNEIEPHIAFIIYRSIVIQILLLIYANGMVHMRGNRQKIAFTLLILALMNGLNWFAVSLGLLHYKIWNAFFFALTFAVFMLLTFLIVKWLTKFKTKEAVEP